MVWVSIIMFIFDASGSMWGQVDGKAKIVIAKEVLTGLVRDLPDNAVVGLIAYGHRRKGDCNDVEELITLGPLAKEKTVARIQGLNAKGKTPISRSIRLTAERLKHRLPASNRNRPSNFWGTVLRLLG